MTDREEEAALTRISSIKKKDVWTIRLLILCGITMMIIFVRWFVSPDHIGYPLIYWLLTIALVFKLVKMLHEWYHYWSLSIPLPPLLKTNFTVDILTTACPGEPKEMIIRTLTAMQAVRYPHTSYLCDEGNDPELKSVCHELGVIHVTRTDKSNAKAGNINNALKQANGDICIVLDPDHVPVPEFIDRVLPYFEDPSIGFVQCVQAYGNQSESLIARGAAEQTYHFYGPMMMCMNSYGTVQAIGANCSFRRAALDSIGGHAAGLSEDMHTAMQLHAKGWRSVYIPEVLTRGLVPATLSAYYKQQLKWSRGTFELLFRVFPKLYKNFTWRQKLHYFTIPLYFLFGLINLIDILIPLLALSLAEVPWEVDLRDFGMCFLPLCALSMTIRLFAQRWLMEKHEHGFHLAGGILRTATWWIFFVGFIYAVFNIKVPYIPTPKEDEHQNYVKLSLPNLLITLCCVGGILYGLSIDWSPYSIAMAFYALINAGMLAFIVLMSQQRFLDRLFKAAASFSPVAKLKAHFSNISLQTEQGLHTLLRSGPIALLLGASLLFLSYRSVNNEDPAAAGIIQKDFGGFFSGIDMNKEAGNEQIAQLGNKLKNHFEIISFTEKWNTGTLALEKDLDAARALNAIPFINIELPETNNTMWQQISNGNDQSYLEALAEKFRAYQSPVFINFSPGFDEQAQSSARNSGHEFVRAWQYVYTFFNNLGISNITWVWSPKHPESRTFYPGPKFVDWIGASCLDYGDPARNGGYSFSELYTPFRGLLGDFQKPFIITELGTLSGSRQAEWFGTALRDVREKYHEIHALILSDVQKNTMRNDKAYTGNFSFDKNKDAIACIAKEFNAALFSKEILTKSKTTPLPVTYHSAFVSGEPGKFQLLINGKPYYIKGVAYNTAHDWRDGNMPLTRRQVEKDMQKIKAMGANTIRRYDYGIYDRNVLNIASEYDLHVLYGFWFDPAIDYYKDSEKVAGYIDDVLAKVNEFKDHSSVIAWSLGNETWGLLKHNYSKPYLTKVRQSYIAMIEQLAEQIHAIDSSRPILSCIEHEEYQLPGELAAFHDCAPSIDVIGINSYYREQISKLNHVWYQFDSLRPYLVSEFGPRGYWDPDHNKTSNGLLVEDNESEKAEWYKEQWTNYIAAFKGYNVGGMAYCWHDRMEGSNTWFGITDYKGRIKPSYYALKSLWSGSLSEPLPAYGIHAPEKIRPGLEYTFRAVTSRAPSKTVHYEWALHKDDYLDNVSGLHYNENGPDVRIRIPEAASDYRLYLYVSDNEGNVSTASVPIRVY